MTHSSGQRLAKTDTDVLIIGAGISGLYAAYRLEKSSISYVVLEAETRAGGRVFSRSELHSHLGLTLDEGANLINSTDTLALKLMNNFGIKYVRRLTQGTDSMHYLIDGREFTQEAMDQMLFTDSEAAISKIVDDQAIWRTDEERDVDPKFVNESISSYLARISAGPILQKVLRSFFWSEYGRTLEELNLYVLFDYLEIDMNCPCFKLIPNVDEAYTVPKGTGQIVQSLEGHCHSNIVYGRRVVQVCEDEGILRIDFVNAEGLAGTLTARHLFFAAPLHSLKNIKVSVEGISQIDMDEARRATYARGTKLHLKFTDGFHAKYKFNGILLTDSGEQIWPSSLGQGGSGLLTVLTGPLPQGRAAAVELTAKVLKALDKVYPGLSDSFVAMERSDAPMSYSGALRPGETAHLGIHRGGTHWTTIGEASSPELQGYLEGALRSADLGVSRLLVMRHSTKSSRAHPAPTRLTK